MSGRGSETEFEFGEELERLPVQAPVQPRTKTELLRVWLIEHPDRAVKLKERYAQRVDGARRAGAFTRARPATLRPGMTGRYRARVILDDPAGRRRYAIAVWYEPSENQAPA